MNGTLPSSKQTWRHHGAHQCIMDYVYWYQPLIKAQQAHSNKNAVQKQTSVSNGSVRDTVVFLLRFFFFLLPQFRYRLLSKDSKLFHLFKSIKSSLRTSATTDWVAQGATTQHNLASGCPVVILVVWDNRTTVNFEPCCITSFCTITIDLFSNSLLSICLNFRGFVIFSLREKTKLEKKKQQAFQLAPEAHFSGKCMKPESFLMVTLALDSEQGSKKCQVC